MKNKTIRQWFEQCGETWANEAINNTSEVSLNYTESSLRMALYTAFEWDDTYQGKQFWKKISDGLKHDNGDKTPENNEVVGRRK